MGRAASWIGSPSVKGKTEAVRMAMLTAGLAGLQYVTPLNPLPLVISLYSRICALLEIEALLISPMQAVLCTLADPSVKPRSAF